MLNTEFNEFAECPRVDLYPKHLRPSIDAIKANDCVYHTINNGVYNCGLSTSQSAYDKAIDELTVSFMTVSTNSCKNNVSWRAPVHLYGSRHSIVCDFAAI
jgi:glutathionyl-hydroquinone reductase